MSSCANGCTGNDCTAGRCGDGILQASEQCDDDNTVSESCAYGLMSCVVCGSTCQLVNGAVSYCGDKVIQSAAGELCDDGNSSNLDLCSTGCKTCGILVGPALSMLSDDSGDQGLEFLVTANTTIVQFVSHNQGKPSNIVLRPVTSADVSARPIVQRVQLPANLDSDGNTIVQNVTVNVNWPLTAGMTYTISDQEGSNSVFSAVSGGTYPNTSLPGIDILGAWSAGDSDFNIPESTNTTYWMTFTGFHACLQ
jgi:cysteine-rich repeat protein